MKEQYVGDANDYRKYALLRALSGGGQVIIGIAWMLTPADGGNDGNKLAYLEKPALREFDPELFDLLKHVSGAPDRRRLVLIEENATVPNAIYFNATLPDALLGRRGYFAEMRAHLQTADLIFYDPDNGLDVPSKGKGGKNSSKYVYRDEIEATFASGHSVLVYQHFPHEERVGFVRRRGVDLGRLCASSTVWAFSTAHVVFLLVVNPQHMATVGVHAERAASVWPASFIRGQRLV